MGVFTVPIHVGISPAVSFLEFDAIVDTGATVTSLPASVLDGLGVARIRKEPFRLANGEVEELDIGLAWVRINGKETPTWVAFAEENSAVLLGAYTLEGLFLGVDPHAGRLIDVSGYR